MNLTRKKIVTAAGLFVAGALLVFVVIRGAVARAGSDPDDPTALIPEKYYKETRPAKSGSAPAPAETGLDLLDLIQIPKDTIAGVWGFQDRALITSSEQWGRLQLPCVPPEEYDLSFKVIRKRGVNALVLGFVQGGRQGTVAIDGADGHTSWIALSSGSDNSSNETSTVGKVLKWNKESRVVVAVRKESVAVTVDGKTLTEFKGGASRIAFPAGWNVPNSKTLFLGSWESVFRIDEARLIPVTGTATLLR